MNKSELKPCPFCGGEAIRLIDFDDEYERVYLESIHCRSCHARVAWQETAEEAAEAWNRRVELTGEWLEDEYGYCRCSICGYEHDDPETTTPYCPNCGAKMESEDLF